MDIHEKYTATSPAPDRSTKLLWLPVDLHEWFKWKAKRQGETVSAIMREALREYRAAREITEEKNDSIT